MTCWPELGEHYHGPVGFVLHAFGGPAIYLATAGVLTAWYVYVKNPAGRGRHPRGAFSGIYQLLVNKYYFDDFNEAVFAGGARGMGRLLWKLGDVMLIDGLIVNGSARVVGWVSGIVRRIQTGYLYTYAFSMIIGLLLMLFWFVFRYVRGGGMIDYPIAESTDLAAGCRRCCTAGHGCAGQHSLPPGGAGHRHR